MEWVLLHLRPHLSLPYQGQEWWLHLDFRCWEAQQVCPAECSGQALDLEECSLELLGCLPLDHHLV